MRKNNFEYLINPLKIFSSLGSKGLFRWMDDEEYIKLFFRGKMNETLDLTNPKTYNEKIQWLKLYDRNELYTNLVDKYKVRKYVTSKIGEEYLIPLLGIWNSPDDIEFEELPPKFVLKCTHDSGGVFICDDKSKLNIPELNSKLKKSLKKNYFWAQREWPYKNVTPKIVAEKFMVDNDTNELRDYKFFCFDGTPKFMFVATNRGIDTRFDFFDLGFNHIPVEQHYKNADDKSKITKPENFELMIEISKKLSEDLPHVRVDLYEINGKVYFGELTFYHFSGWESFNPREYDELFGSFINLPEKG